MDTRENSRRHGASNSLDRLSFPAMEIHHVMDTHESQPNVAYEPNSSRSNANIRGIEMSENDPLQPVGRDQELRQ